MQCEFLDIAHPDRRACGHVGADFCEVTDHHGERKWMWLCRRHVNRYRIIYCWQVEQAGTRQQEKETAA